MERQLCFAIILVSLMSIKVGANPCSNNKVMTKIYEKALKVLKIPSKDIPAISFSQNGYSTQVLLNSLKDFTKKYQEQTGGNCPIDVLDDITSADFEFIPDRDPKNWNKLSIQVREALLDAFESAVMWKHGQNPEGSYCETLLRRIKEAGTTAISLMKIDHSKCPPNIQPLGERITAFVKRFQTTEKLTCRRAEVLWDIYGTLAHKAEHADLTADWLKVPEKERLQLQNWLSEAGEIERELEDIEATGQK
ncbi:unnamed protein product [Allacma fusca]|uniref:Uncharacterized protein n=1 Tax=Allacma fusca TaxID=39272 RepID=A0A8J2LF46_9HEXA|nr:unnamed protein product [Allacma fusca]